MGNVAWDSGDWYSGKWGFINKSGKEIIPIKYDHARVFSDGLAAVRLNDKWGFIDPTGKIVTQFKYDEVHQGFSNGRAVVAVGGGGAITIDKKGNIQKSE